MGLFAYRPPRTTEPRELLLWYKNITEFVNNPVVEAANIIGTISIGQFAAGLRPVQIVSALPSLPSVNYPQGSVVFLTTDNKLYRSDGSNWVASVATSDLTGQISAGQIAAGAIDTDQLAAGAVTAGIIEAGAIAAVHVGANEIIAQSANIKDLIVGTTKITDNAVTVRSYAYTSPGVTLGTSASGGGTIIQQVAVTTSGSPVLIIASGQALMQGDGRSTLSIYRDTTQLRFWNVDVQDNLSEGGNSTVPAHAVLVDTPSSGSYTYYFRGYRTGGTDHAVYMRTLYCLETKK